MEVPERADRSGLEVWTHSGVHSKMRAMRAVHCSYSAAVISQVRSKKESTRVLQKCIHWSVDRTT